MHVILIPRNQLLQNGNQDRFCFIKEWGKKKLTFSSSYSINHKADYDILYAVVPKWCQILWKYC